MVISSYLYNTRLGVTSNGLKYFELKIHECVFVICSKYHRLLVRKARQKLGTHSENNGLEIDAYKIYSIDIVRKYFDLIYGVNASELTVREIIQIVDLLFDCGYTDEKEYPWQFRKMMILNKILYTIVEILGWPRFYINFL